VGNTTFSLADRSTICMFTEQVSPECNSLFGPWPAVARPNRSAVGAPFGVDEGNVGESQWVEFPDGLAGTRRRFRGAPSTTQVSVSTPDAAIRIWLSAPR